MTSHIFLRSNCKFQNHTFIQCHQLLNIIFFIGSVMSDWALLLYIFLVWQLIWIKYPSSRCDFNYIIIIWKQYSNLSIFSSKHAVWCWMFPIVHVYVWCGQDSTPIFDIFALYVCLLSSHIVKILELYASVMHVMGAVRYETRFIHSLFRRFTFPQISISFPEKKYDLSGKNNLRFSK